MVFLQLLYLLQTSLKVVLGLILEEIQYYQNVKLILRKYYHYFICLFPFTDEGKVHILFLFALVFLTFLLLYAVFAFKKFVKTFAFKKHISFNVKIKLLKCYSLKGDIVVVT